MADRLQLSQGTRDTIEHFAKLEGLSYNKMIDKMVQFYSDCLYQLAEHGFNPETLINFLLQHRMDVIQRGMKDLLAALKGEDAESAALAGRRVQELGKEYVHGPQEPAPSGIRDLGRGGLDIHHQGR